jgi:hypothetical protein
MGRTTWYESVEEMQTDLHASLELYNTKRPHRCRGMEGRAPYTVFRAGLKRARAATKKPRKEEKTAA